MNRTVSYVVLVVAGAILLIVLPIVKAEWLSDSNAMLSNFVGQQYLGLLGIILTITLASCAQLHIALNRIEEAYNIEHLHRTRANIRHAAYWLIVLFVFGVSIVVAKSIMATSEEIEAFFNGATLFILSCKILILISIMSATFGVPPVIRRDGQ